MLFGLIANINFLFDEDLWEDVIFIVDNDKSLHGNLVNGVLVVGPEKIDNVEFDEILVLVWAYNQIKNQLLALDVPSYKIFSINKRLVTKSVFEDEYIRQTSLKFVSDLCVFSRSFGLDIYVEAGTLLGIVRGKDLISWDTDVDFSVNDIYFLTAFDLLVEFSKIHNANYRVDVNIIAAGSSQITGNIIIQDKIIPFDVFTRAVQSGLSLSASGDFFACDAMHFNGVETITYDDYFFTVPVDYKKYLSSVYGDDWHFPKQNFSYADFNYST